jgi:hypothetical protein
LFVTDLVALVLSAMARQSDGWAANLSFESPVLEILVRRASPRGESDGVPLLAAAGRTEKKDDGGVQKAGLGVFRVESAVEEARIGVAVAGKIADEDFHLHGTSDWTWMEDREGTGQVGYPGGGGSKTAVAFAGAELGVLTEVCMVKQEAAGRTPRDWQG